MSSSPGRAPGSQRRSVARTAVVWDVLRAHLEGAEEISVLDIGGGTGGFAVRVAELGHRVTVVDPNPDALATLARRAEETGVAERVTGRQGDLAGVRDLVPAEGVDLVLCHGVLEVVDDPDASVAVLADVLRSDGALSLLVHQRHAAVVARAMAGHFGQAQALLDDPEGSGPHRRFTLEEVTASLRRTGLTPVEVHAVRVFVDLVPSAMVDLEPGATEALVALEKAVAGRPEYLPLGTQLHVLARRV